MIERIKEKVLSGEEISDGEIRFLIDFPEDNIQPLLNASYEIKRAFFSSKIDLCSIANVKSGLCSEDCKFCAQSAHYKTESSVYEYIGEKKLREAIEFYKNKGVRRFALVTSGKTLDEETFDIVLNNVKLIKDFGLVPDISVGILTKDQLLRLKEVGLNGFHHNLETSRTFFPKICSTHDYDEDVKTVKDAVELGLYVCSGGIFGIGESWEDRVELAYELKSLGVQSVPINFLNPIKGTPLEDRPVMSEVEALKIIAIYRFILPDRQIRVCGGRSRVFNERSKSIILKSGASGIMVGDYLTTTGFPIDSDLKDIKDICNEK
ncbi:biotin synthase [Calditerrivibrio nitroreducens DSM 19672]|uniref:Biotin synthase n=2 Tax=Calditerrivibrio nitroreducens TaxID=477976 RepID=E4TER7_CALNY|nr:biotin synthase [Calditerrivibrio nitroreducens DSM 19672]